MKQKHMIIKKIQRLLRSFNENMSKVAIKITLSVILSVTTSLITVYYQMQKEKKLEFYKEFLNTISEYSDIFLVIDSMSNRRLDTDMDIAYYEHDINDVTRKLEKLDVYKLTHTCIVATIYDKKLELYCNNIVKTIYARLYGMKNLDLSNEYCEQLPSYNTSEIQKLLTYKWSDSIKFKDIRREITLEFIMQADKCYLLNKKHWSDKTTCHNYHEDHSCMGIDGIASGMDYLISLIIYSNYRNIINRIEGQTT
jgi:hypothetical protein